MSAYLPGEIGSPQKNLRQQFMQLQKALQSGDLSSAQSAYSGIEDSLQNGAQSSKSPVNGNNQATTDFQTLGKALQNGDISSAQSALILFQQDLQPGGQPGTSGYGGIRGRTGRFNSAMAKQMKDFKSLATALQSGDTSSAQTAMASVMQDMQNGKPGSFPANGSAAQTLQNLQDAVQSGNVSDATSAFSTLMQDLGGVGSGGGSSSPYSSYQTRSYLGNTVDMTA